MDIPFWMDNSLLVASRSPTILWIFGALIVVEIIWRKGIRGGTYGAGEAIASLGIGVGRFFGMTVMGAAVAGLFIAVYHVRLFTIEMSGWQMWAVLLLGADVTYYCHHRFKHRCRWMWAEHAVHHSGNHLNFLMAYRLGWTALFAGTWLIYLPLIWIGFPPGAVVTAFAIHLVGQFWVHTEMIPKLGPLEWVLTTPSHHRVHHSTNPIYLDKNFGGVLIIWDRIFGTFQAELEEEPCRYGLVTPLRSTNPIVIALHEWRGILRDVKRARSWKQRLRVAFGDVSDVEKVLAEGAKDDFVVMGAPAEVRPGSVNETSGHAN